MTTEISVMYGSEKVKYHLLNMLKIECDINQQYLKTVDLHFVKYEYLSLTWSCGSRKRDTTSSGWKLKLNNLAAKGLTPLSRLPHGISLKKVVEKTNSSICLLVK